MSLTDDLVDASVRHSIYLERHKAKTVREILGALKGVEKGIQRDLMQVDLQNMTRRNLDKLLIKMRKNIKAGYEPVVALLDAEIRGLAGYEPQWQTNLFSKTIPVSFEYAVPAAEQVYAAAVARPFQGRLLKEWYSGLADGQFRRVREVIRTGFVEGTTTPAIVRSIIGSKATPGIIEQSRRGATAAVRTALGHTANVARNETYKANSKLIKSVEWISTLDGRTTAICRARDGMEFPVDSGPRPPAHVNCRSSTVPVIKSAQALGLKNIPQSTRSSMNGQVSGDLNYDGWLRKQSKPFQDEVLGKAKGDLFRGGLKMDKFVDRSGNELTLEKLRKIET